MILYIDTTLGHKLKVALYNENDQQIVSLVKQVNRNESEKLLKTVDEVLGNKTATLPDKLARSPNGIIVAKGPKGRFSAIRAGVVCANALGFAWNVPVLGIKPIDDLNDAIKKIIKLKTFQKPVLPVYEKGPNLGIKNN